VRFNSTGSRSPLSSPPTHLLPNVPPSQVHPKTVVMVLATALVFVGALYLFWQLRLIVRWALIAVFLAVALDPAVTWLNRRGHMPRIVAILLVFLALLLALVGLSALVLPPLVGQVRSFVDTLVQLAQQPGGAEQALRQFANRYGLEFLTKLVIDWRHEQTTCQR